MNQGKTLLAVALGLSLSGCSVLQGLPEDKSTGALALYLETDRDSGKPMPCRSISVRLNEVTEAINTSPAVWSEESFYDESKQATIIPGIQAGTYVINGFRCYAGARVVFENYARYIDQPTFEAVTIHKGKITLSGMAFVTGHFTDKEGRVYFQFRDAGSLKQDALIKALRANDDYRGWELVAD
ncbi:hypothetical protein KDD30_18115 (plasmid) [Photobacterium sp. GJ3]|uniref:hypothetical protein n=1 Tax=Photobacterium sp. GJ3 TaxID=2829502 RepID=UPI001B8CE2E4|nr:hypothetical protein [Photobacterium sp. GJ3]QUJ70067.1 hypothetical protein KDD30_18115 [Photobacterium sp. GJ3]